MAILDRVIREPAALLGLVTLVLAGGSIFDWWTLTQEQYQWVLALLGALILVMRQYVTPISSPTLPVGTVVNEHSPLPTSVVTPQGG